MMPNAEVLTWPQAFEREHGRPPRVLHIGNIANNAYLNAKILRSRGIDCDVLCYDYYHIMGCPEWEDADFEGDFGDQFQPDWTRVELHGYTRPEWFVQGPLMLCLDYLDARRRGDGASSTALWKVLGVANHTRVQHPDRVTMIRLKLAETKRRLSRLLQLVVESMSDPDIRAQIEDRIRSTFRPGWRNTLANLAVRAAAAIAQILRPVRYGINVIRALAVSNDLDPRLRARFGTPWWETSPSRRFAASLIISSALAASVPLHLAVGVGSRLLRALSATFRPRPSAVDFSVLFDSVTRRIEERFPERALALERGDLATYKSTLPAWQKIFRHYDLVHGYATDGVYALMTGKPYVAFEHGTIRNAPFENTAQGRICALVYLLSDWACITNADNMRSARRLGLRNFSFVPHPVNELDGGEQRALALAARLRADNSANFVVFHPARQHWTAERHPDWEKGNDIFIKGFARFVHEVEPSALAVFVDWGACVKESRALIDTLGIAHRVRWIAPVPSLQMMDYIRAADLTADQFYLGAFGSTLPKVLACGRLAMLYLDPEIHAECFRELPPVLNARTSEDVLRGLTRASRDTAWSAATREAGRRWYEHHHSNSVIADTLTDIYRGVLDQRVSGSAPPRASVSFAAEQCTNRAASA